MKRVRIRYYALFREQAGCQEEEVETATADLRALYSELAARHGFRLQAGQLRVAVNGDFVAWSYALSTGDEVVFIPPVAGG
ncbi:MAG: MoaD/ThiS family protein [Steroidobacteraceae bacterium]|jgi:molybdopterin converting factor subunit 1